MLRAFLQDHREELIEGRVHNQIEVPEEQQHWVRVALDRMLKVV